MQEAVIEQRLKDIQSGNYQENPLWWIGQDRRGYGMPTKDRWSLSYGLGGQNSGWEIPDLIDFEYSYLNFAGATTFNGFILGIMPGTNAPLIGSPDPIGASLAAANGGRVVGSGSQQYFTILSCWAFLRTNAGGVYTAAAGTTLALNVISAGANANQALTALTAAFSVNGATQFWTQMPIVAVPAERQVSLTGAIIPGVAQGFYGDVLQGTLVTTGALNIQGNNMAVVLELA
jgi:hypothetical protein